MDKLGFHLDWIHHSGPVYKLKEPISPFSITFKFHQHIYTLDQYYKHNSVLGFLILKDNQIISERYFHGSDKNSLFLSNSIQKSYTSTLVGIAHDEGNISNIDDPIINYLPDFSHSGFNRVTIKQTLQMATGIAATEDYLDPNATIVQFGKALILGKPIFIDFLKSLKANPKIKPGTDFNYTGVDTEMLGLLVEEVTGVPLNKYMQDKIWSKIGAQSDAFLYRAQTQPAQCAFGCLSATLRDYGRFGLMMMNDGALNDRSRVVSSAWVKQATIPQPNSAQPPKDESLRYGYQWWIPVNQQDKAFQAMGIFGQILYVNSTKHIVIVQISALPKPDNADRGEESTAVINAIVNKLSQ